MPSDQGLCSLCSFPLYFLPGARESSAANCTNFTHNSAHDSQPVLQQSRRPAPPHR